MFETLDKAIFIAKEAAIKAAEEEAKQRELAAGLIDRVAQMAALGILPKDTSAGGTTSEYWRAPMGDILVRVEGGRAVLQRFANSRWKETDYVTEDELAAISIVLIAALS